MLQRIQSIWLLLAALTVSCLLFIPMVTATVSETEYYVLANGLHQKIGGQTSLLQATYPLLVSTIASALVCLVNIFNFRNRNRQKLIARVSALLIVGLSFLSSQAAKRIPGGLEAADYKIGMFLPIIAVLFCVLAIRGINNDEKLVRAADRLR